LAPPSFLDMSILVMAMVPSSIADVFFAFIFCTIFPSFPSFAFTLKAVGALVGALSNAEFNIASCLARSDSAINILSLSASVSDPPMAPPWEPAAMFPPNKFAMPYPASSISTPNPNSSSSSLASAKALNTLSPPSSPRSLFSSSILDWFTSHRACSSIFWVSAVSNAILACSRLCLLAELCRFDRNTSSCAAFSAAGRYFSLSTTGGN